MILKPQYILTLAALCLLSGCSCGHTMRVDAAIRACDSYFAEIPAHDGVIRAQMSVEIIACGSDAAMEREWGKTPLPGYCWMCAPADPDGVYQIWTRYGQLENGNRILQPWATQHEFEHAVDIWLNKHGFPDAMSDPDEWVRERFYENR